MGGGGGGGGGLVTPMDHMNALAESHLATPITVAVKTNLEKGFMSSNPTRVRFASPLFFCLWLYLSLSSFIYLTSPSFFILFLFFPSFFVLKNVSQTGKKKTKNHGTLLHYKQTMALSWAIASIMKFYSIHSDNIKCSCSLVVLSL